MKKKSSSQSTLERAQEVLEIEAQAILNLRKKIDCHFDKAVALISSCTGRVVVSGMGKSGHIARKIASTMASTGTPAFFVHPAEAQHGDLGMITQNDIFVALSNSGESVELLTIVPLIKRRGAKLIAMTGNPKSTLAKEADVHLDTGVAKEACPLNLAPTASTTAALALGDALAIVLLEEKGFNEEDFAHSHPGGALGRRLLTRVSDVMRTSKDIPKVLENAKISEAVLEMTRGQLGMTAVVNAQEQVIGIFTDGDLRRALDKVDDLRNATLRSVMTLNPLTIGAEQLAVEAVQLMEQRKVNQLLVVTDEKKLIGALNMHDLFRAKVI